MQVTRSESLARSGFKPLGYARKRTRRGKTIVTWWYDAHCSYETAEWNKPAQRSLARSGFKPLGYARKRTRRGKTIVT